MNKLKRECSECILQLVSNFHPARIKRSKFLLHSEHPKPEEFGEFIQYYRPVPSSLPPFFELKPAVFDRSDNDFNVLTHYFLENGKGPFAVIRRGNQDKRLIAILPENFLCIFRIFLC